MTAIRIYKRLRELLDVLITSPTDGQVLAYEASSSKWKNKTGAGGGASRLLDLTDVVGTDGAGKAPVSNGSDVFTLTDIATQSELDSAVAALSAVYQPVDSDLTAIAALSTTSFGRSLLTAADAAALRADAGLGTAATHAATDFDASGAAAAAQAASQPLDSDLTAIAALSTTSFGRALLALADAAAGRTAFGLGTLATQSGTFSGTSSGTNTGDQTSVTGNAGTATALATARNIDGQAFDGTANITVIAPGTHAATSKTTPVDADELPLVDSAASNVLKKLTWANLKATLKTYFDTLYLAGTASAGGDLTGSYPNPTLAAAGPGATGPIGSTSAVPVVTIDAKGRVIALTSASPAIDTVGAGTDITTNNVTSTKHGLAPKSPADATQFLNGAATPTYAQPKDSDLATTDVTTNNVSTSKHGFAPKAPNVATQYLDGTGAYSTPAGSGTSLGLTYMVSIRNLAF